MTSSAKRWLSGGAVVSLAALGLYLIPPWLDARSRAREQDRVLADAATIARDFETCMVGEVAPAESADFISDRLLLDRDAAQEFTACVQTRHSDLKALLDTLEPGEEEPEVLSELRHETASSGAVYTPGQTETCGVLIANQRLQADLRAAGGKAVTAVDPYCPASAQQPDGNARPQPVAAPTSDPGWRLQHRTSDQAIVLRRGDMAGPQLAAIAPEREAKLLELPPQLEHSGLVRWGPDAVVAVARPDDTAHVPGTEPYRLEVAKAHALPFASLPTPRSFGAPVELFLTPQRWFLVSAGASQADPNGLTIHISDNNGTSFRAVAADLPHLPAPRRFEVLGHADDTELLLLAVRTTRGSADRVDAFHDLPAQAHVAAIRVDAAGEIRTSHASFGHEAAGDWGVSVAACATTEGAMAILDGRTVVNFGDAKVQAVHRFSSAEHLSTVGLTVACHGDDLVVLGRTRAAPPPAKDPTPPHDSAGGPLLRYVCDAAGCDEGRVVTDWARRWDLRRTAAGVRALVELHGGPVSTVHAVDEPPGGELERREILADYYAAADVVVWDGTLFAPGSHEGGWGWF